MAKQQSLKPTGNSDRGTTTNQWVPFACSQCGMGPCPARAHVVNGVVVKVEGNPKFKDRIPSPSLTCVKVMGLPLKLYNPYRIKAPVKRTNPKKGANEDPGFVEISWDEAYSLVAGKLKEIRDKGIIDEQGVPRVAQSTGNSPAAQTNKPLGWFNFWGAWGETEAMGGGGGVKCFHAEHVFGELWHRAMVNVPDFTYCNYVLMLGRNQNAMTVQLGAAGLKAYADAKMRGMKHVHISPDLNSTAAKADEWIPIKIKTDAALLYSMLHVVLHEMDWRQACDIPFLKRTTNSPYLVGPHGYFVRDAVSQKPMVWDPTVGKARPFDEAQEFALEGSFTVSGVEVGPDGETYPVESARPSFQLLIEMVKDYTPELVAKITDIPVKTIRHLAADFVEHASVGQTVKIDGVELPYRPVSINLGRGVNNGWGAYQAVWAQHVLLMLVGAIEVPGANLSCHSVLYMFTPIARDPDGFLLYFIAPTTKDKWQWPPKFRHGWYTLTPLANQVPDVDNMAPWQRFGFGADTLSWRSFTEPVKHWPNSVPDFFMFERSNPVASQFDSNLIRKALEKIPFTVHIGYVMNDTNWYADVILPGAIELENYQLEAIPSGHKGPWEYAGWSIRQPAVKPIGEVKDATEIFTELADRLGMLPEYNQTINITNGLMGTPWELEPGKHHSVEEIMDALCHARTRGEHDLEWFRQNGMFLEPVPKTHHYLHPEIAKQEIRYQLPYQEAVKKSGEQLMRRLHEVDVDWWNTQAEEYTHGLPEWRDFRKPYEQVYEAGEEYDTWTCNHGTSTLYCAHNADVPWMVEAAEDAYDVAGIMIHPDTAKKKGIKDGDTICLESRTGKTTGKAIVSNAVGPGLVAACNSFGRRNPVMAKLAWPNVSETEKIDLGVTDEAGSSSMHTIVKVYKV